MFLFAVAEAEAGGPDSYAGAMRVASRLRLPGESQGKRDIIARVLERNRGQTAEAAKELGVHRSTLWRKMKRLRLSP